MKFLYLLLLDFVLRSFPRTNEPFIVVSFLESKKINIKTNQKRIATLTVDNKCGVWYTPVELINSIAQQLSNR